MKLRTIIWLIVAVLILTGSTILCALRWDVWFTMPAEPEWTGGDTLSTRFVTFRDDTTYACQYADTLSMVVLGDVHNTLNRSDYMQIAALSPEMQCYAQLGDFVEREQFYYKQMLMPCARSPALRLTRCPYWLARAIMSTSRGLTLSCRIRGTSRFRCHRTDLRTAKARRIMSISGICGL